MADNDVSPTDDNGANELRELLGAMPELETAVPREFMPWHRPRKHFVRDRQWKKEIETLIRNGHTSDRILNYLTLPGDDLLDIRYLHDTLCVEHDLQMRFLGFNTSLRSGISEQAHVNVAQFLVKRLSHIHNGSSILMDDIRDAGREQSNPWLSIREFAAFHAINLDLCDGIASGNLGVQYSYRMALEWILRFQQSASHDFVIFITTRIDSQSIDNDWKEILENYLRHVLDRCDEFRSRMISTHDLDQQSDAADVVTSLTEETRVLVSLVEWLIYRADAYQLRAKIGGIMSYKIKPDSVNDDLVSLCIRCSPRPRLAPDAVGIAGHPPGETDNGDICAMSVHVPSKVANCARVDEILAIRSDIRKECIDMSAQILGLVGYDENEYRTWLGEKCQTDIVD